MRRMYFGFIEEPFPWLPIACAFLAGLVIMPVIGWGVLELVDCDLGTE